MNALAGAYVPGSSVLHRTPASAKLAGLVVGCALVAVTTSPTWIAVAAAAVAGLYVVAGVGAAAAWAQVRPLRWFVPVILVVQLVIVDATTAVTLTARIVVAVALAGLVTVTTRTSDLMAAIERALRPGRVVGLDPARVSLVLSLAVRSVPVVSRLAARVREAQRARGRERDLRAFAVPLVVGVLRHADALGEALCARGLDD